MSMRLPSDLAQLRAATAAGQTFKYLLFCGHRKPTGRTAAVTASCLSQWYEAAFTLAGVSYPTAEHYMMARKAALFGDAEMQSRIVEATDPGRAKALGRRVSGFDEAIWNAQRRAIVVAGNLAKFDQHPALRRFLLATGDQVLVEASPMDGVWGIGMSAQDPAATDPLQWRGLNMLGFALMEVRARLLR